MNINSNNNIDKFILMLLQVFFWFTNLISVPTVLGSPTLFAKYENILYIVFLYDTNVVLNLKDLHMYLTLYMPLSICWIRMSIHLNLRTSIIALTLKTKANQNKTPCYASSLVQNIILRFLSWTLSAISLY